MLAEVAQLQAAIADELDGRPRQQHLTAVSEREQPRDPVQGRSVVVAVALLGRAGVQGHPHPRSFRPPLGQPALGVGRCRDGVRRRENAAWKASPMVLKT